MSEGADVKPLICSHYSSKQKYRAIMQSYTILILLLSFFVHDALAAAKWEQQRGLFVDDTWATKTGKANNANKKSTPTKFLAMSPRVYKSSKQFEEIVSWHPDSLKACYL
jgi:hypothetical protein